MTFGFGPRRATFIDVSSLGRGGSASLSTEEIAHFETLDLVYRSLCALLYNYVPTSGHPGGSISSGRIVESLLYGAMEYDLSDPKREDADLLVYAAGHKALGLYATWALRNEIARIAAPDLLPDDPKQQLRLEDLLGFRRNPVTATPLFVRFGAKALDGHPTPATPFVRVATGASGVGVPTAIGLAIAAADTFGADSAPRIHILEGEGGMTPGRVAEALAAAGTASLRNAILHVDWNQASIDSNRVCREDGHPGDYVQWTPAELAYLHDWNVLFVEDGMNFAEVARAQRAALALDNGQPTAIVYRTTKGWQYGIEGRASHGAGHKLCSESFHHAVYPLLAEAGTALPRCEANAQRCDAGRDESIVEECFWEALTVVRMSLERNRAAVDALARRLRAARERLDRRARRPRPGAPRAEAVFERALDAGVEPPANLALAPGHATTLRGELGRVLNHYNRASDGALLVASADLLGSTSVNAVASGFPDGYFNASTNAAARVLSTGGICEDSMAAILAGVSSFGRHVGVGSSYGAFLAPLGHVAMRLHAIGSQARRAVEEGSYRTVILACAHAGLKTGEDGPTHADPQALQLLQDNFPAGTAITLTPWEPGEIWPLVSAALARRPAILAPFVTRPTERVPDRARLGLAPAAEAVSGVYRLRRARGRADGAVVLQESGVVYAFVDGALPRLEREGIDLDVFVVTSAELFDALSAEERERIYPERTAREALGITGFTRATIERWILSERGRDATLHPFKNGHYLGSGPAEKVLAEAGLDGEGQYRAIVRYLEAARAQRATASSSVS